MSNLLVSVIIPAYNQGRFIVEAIESVWRQDYLQGQIEIIVVDDGSTDGTREVVSSCRVSGSRCQAQSETYNLKPETSHLRYIYQPNQGKAMAMKAGIEAAQGKYIFNLDADDVFLPEKIKKVVDIFENDSEISYVAHPVIYWNEQKNVKNAERFPKFMRGRKIYGKDILNFFYKINKFYGCGSSFCGRADILKKIPINKKEIGYSIDALLVLFSANSGYGYFIDELLSLYRLHSRAYSSEESIKRAEIDFFANEAILQEIEQGNFEEEIKMLQALKVKISRLKFKELHRKKTMSDVLEVWRFVMANRKVLGKDFLRIIRNYRFIQRSVRF
jgi:glycosyltransferase involved in cell wall biosynthesis